jgi:hypothetical protein
MSDSWNCWDKLEFNIGSLIRNGKPVYPGAISDP